MNYSLIKPRQEDFYNVEDQNKNMDTIDAILKALSDAVASGASEQEIEELRTALAAHLADDTKHLQVGERVKWNDTTNVVTGLKTVKSNKDENDIFTTVMSYRKSDNTLFQKSVLSGGTSPNYTKRTITTYDTDGSTVLKTDVYTLTYDDDGDLVGEE